MRYSMSSIVELTIKGVRSFSHEEEQRLKFLRPLTVITGQNGAGKTTIIECLRYVCSGCFPPGAQNSCFVRDLKKAGCSEVTGQVDLKFKDKTSKEIVVSRPFKAVRKRNSKKIEFQSLPSEISILHKDGRLVSSSPKIKELNEKMVDGLGVSQTIMVNVIFCHQEESNWPLSDAKHLKEKFDEIFGATRYSKALDSIKKLQKDQNLQIELLRKDVENCEEWVKEAKQETENLEKKQAELDAAQAEVDQCSIRLEPLKEELKEIEDRTSHLQEIDTQIRELEARKNAMESSYQEIENYCKNSEDETELSSIIERNKKIKAKKDAEYCQLQQEMNRLEQHKRQLEIQEGELNVEQRGFVNLKSTLQQCVKNITGAVPACQSTIDWNDDSSLKESLQNFQEGFQTEKKKMETQLNNVRKSISQLTHHESADVTFLEKKKKEKQKLEADKKELVLRCGQELMKLIGAPPENEWLGMLIRFVRSQKKDMRDVRERLYFKQVQKCRLELMEKQLLDKLESKRRTLNELNEGYGDQEREVIPPRQGFQGLVQGHHSSSSKVRDKNPPSSFFNYLFYSLKNPRTEHPVPSSTNQSVHSDVPPPTSPRRDLECPLCSQKIMGNESEKQTILNIMKDKLPSELKGTSLGAEKILEKWENILKRCRSSFLKEKIAKLTAELEPVQNELRELSSDIKKEKETLQEMQETENSAVELIPDISILNYLIKAISKCTNEIEAFKNQQKSADTQRKLEGRQTALEYKISVVTTGLVTLENYVKDLDRFASLGENLDRNRSELQSVQEEISVEQEKMTSLRPIVEKFEKRIRLKKEKLKRLREYRSQLKQKHEKIAKVDQQLYTAMEDKRQVCDSLPTQQSVQNMEQEKADLERRKWQADGSLFELSSNVSDIRKKLSQKKYVDVDVKRRDYVIKLRTTEITNKDLKKYYDALDWAIIQFHKIKMEEVNRIVKEYWTKIYKGNDIDYIEIQSELSPEASSRRSYKYRVVMFSDGDGMDMRGCCSAGQKVLASLIIRLALAETFCLSCGVLALDEPTTNLDYENKKGLASALTEIIEEKIKYKDSNFQLIIITHDEAFVDMLESSGYADHFYRVTRDDNSGSSIINRKNISDLQR